MNRRSVSAIIIISVTAVALGTYLVFSKSKPTSHTHSPTTVIAKKTTYQATVSNSIFRTKSSSSLGQYLVSPDGKPLYMYSKDSKGVSNCRTNCLANWQPYTEVVAANTGLPANVGTIARSDNRVVQYTYKGLPLYTYTHDSGNKVVGNDVDGFKLARL